MEKRVLQLTVEEAMKGDVGRGIVRIDENLMRTVLDIVPGDAVEIRGKTTSVAIALPLHYEDYGRDIIRMDGWIRKNVNVSIGEIVEISKADIKDAEHIVLASTTPNERFSSTVVNLIKTYLQNSKIPLGEGDFLPIIGFGFGAPKIFVVVKTVPKGFVICSPYTSIEIVGFSKKYLLKKKEGVKGVSYEDIGGLKNVIQKVREMIELPLKYPEVIKRIGIDPPRGILFYGPPGTGKTLLAKAIANETNANFIGLNGPEIIDKYYGESERKLREIFKEAEEKAPSIIFIDEIDSITPKRDEARGDVERRVVAQLLTLMDGLTTEKNVIVIGSTNRPNDIDPALRRPGRFDREIEFPVPDVNGRKEILIIHTRNMPLAKSVDLDEIARATHGFVGADIAALCREAAIAALRRLNVFQKLEEKKRKISTISTPGFSEDSGKFESENLFKSDFEISMEIADILNNIYIEKEDFLDAMKNVQPSVLREVMIERPNVKWDEIGGLKDVKQQLIEMVEWPLKYPDSFKNIGISPPKGILLYGPPGTGKTMLAKAVATESEANFIFISGPELLSKWVGETEKGIREIFKKARQSAPCIILFDEFDAIGSVRTSDEEGYGSNIRSIINQLLTELDGVKPLDRVFVIASTNRIDLIDPALLRPGRLGRKILVPVPDKETRKEIFKVHMRKMPLAEDVDINLLIERTEGFTGADIENLCREAGIVALRENINANIVYMRHFEEALKNVTPSVSKNLREYYQSIDKKIRGKEIEEQRYIL